MNISQDNNQHICTVAKETLTKIEAVATSAQSALDGASSINISSLANPSASLTSARKQMHDINRQNRESYETLSREPAIARVVVKKENGEQRAYYICRATPITGVNDLASYRAPVGRLASLPIGEELPLPNGEVLTVVERSELHPIQVSNLWDSERTTFEAESFGPLTIESLRNVSFSVPAADAEEDLLEQLLAEESQAINVIDGVRRNVITKMGLRDQPILDQYQDEIFRLPLDKRLLILGPPGTGKTTTLIRRLGQKLDAEFLDENEQRIVKRITTSSSNRHADSWLMFTPTELLKQYLKEAFAREGVPAPDQRIRTWTDYSRVLGRNTFNILKTPSSSGPFILKASVESMAVESFNDPVGWFSDFDGWQRIKFLEGFRKSAKGLGNNKHNQVSEIGQLLQLIVEEADIQSMASTFLAFADEVDGLRTMLSKMKEKTDESIRRSLNFQMNQDKQFFNEFTTFINEIEQASDVESEDFEDQDDEDDEDAAIPKTSRGEVISAYMRAVRAQARAHAGRRKIGQTSRNGKIIGWLGNRTLNKTKLAEVGDSLLVQTAIRPFVNPVKRYIDGISRRYGAYRKLRQKEGRWYKEGGFNSKDLQPLELDIIILATLRGGNDLLGKPNIFRDVDKPIWSPLQRVSGLYKNQILIDEVTDFSPIQIACMAALSEPRLRSFFACGDFNQRLTTWGSKSIDEMRWVLPEIEIKEVTVSYRQSRQLNELSRAIIDAVDGANQKVTLPKHVNNEGVPPALLEHASELSVTVDWLADRIREIERFVGQLPSIAIFVANEDEVESISVTLNEALAGENTQVVACSRGQIIGQDNDVRVFDVQHIKGLEFEAVFFIGIDRLAIQEPELFDKYLYVGATRAATYLGITCDNVLPGSISKLQSMFISDWNTP